MSAHPILVAAFACAAGCATGAHPQPAAPSSAGDPEPMTRVGDPGRHEPSRSLVVLGASIGASLPHLTIQAVASARGYVRDAFLWEARAIASATQSPVDLTKNGVDDFDPSEAQHVEIAGQVGLPLSWKMRADLVGDDGPAVAQTGVGEVRQLTAVTGVRASITNSRHVAIPVGLRWSRRRLLPAAAGNRYRERYLQARFLWFTENEFGIDAEAAWMPWSYGANRFAIVIYSEVIPQLIAAPRPLTCERERRGLYCDSDYPVSIFNPTANNGTYFQFGLRARITIAE